MKKFLSSLLLFFGFIVSAAASAETHALLMFIGDYKAGIPKLDGVQHDVLSARSMAHRMGVKEENILLLQNKELTLEGMQKAFDELDRRVLSGDRVFIYYSGHGSRQKVSDPEARCAESLVTVDGRAFLDTELNSRLQKLSVRAQKIIAMIDSCHSGGVTTRSLSGARYTPKFWSRGGVESCTEPVNLLTRSIHKDVLAAGSGGKNYVYIASAKNDEVSLDEPGKGGFATLAWVQCMSGEARDSDGSGGLTAEEIRYCAQQKIDAVSKGLEGILPQHISIVGNPDMVMTLVSSKAEEPPASQSAAIAPSVSITPAPVSMPVSAAPASISVQTIQLPAAAAVSDPLPDTQKPGVQEIASGATATLLDIFNGRDDRRVVTVTPTMRRLRIGADKFSFSIRSSHEGYLYLMMVGSDGTTFDLLFPNKLDNNNHIQAGKTLQFPRSSWEIVAQGPAGKDHLLAVVAEAPRDLSALPLVNAGPFSMVKASSGGKRSIQLIAATLPAARQDECNTSGKRNLSVVQSCSDAYGAALTVIEEVN